MTTPLEELRTLAAVPASSLSVTKSVTNQLIDKVTKRRHCIVAGPPGTGKTKSILDMRDSLLASDLIATSELVQFHREFSYQDFIDGYRVEDGKFVAHPGVFRTFVDKAGKAPGKIDLFLIDEINRSDVSAVFGEVLSLLEDGARKSITLAKSEKQFTLPSTVVIVGSMNTADKSIALMDFALRRRFSFLNAPPDYDGLLIWLRTFGVGFGPFTNEDYVNAIRALNMRISSHPLLGKTMCLGQSFFVPKRTPSDAPLTIEEVSDLFVESVIPQLEAYLGFGAQHELDKLLDKGLRKILERGGQLTPADIESLIRVLSNDKSFTS